MRKYKLLLLAALLLIAPRGVSALGMDEAVELALQNNNTIKRAGFHPCGFQ